MGALLAKALAVAVFVAGPPAGCPPQAGGCAVRPNVVWVNPEPWMRSERMTTTRHELGHIVDYNFLTDQDRGMFKALTRDGRPWRSPINSPHDRFAEAFRLCVQSTRYVSRATQGYGYYPTLRTHRKVCRWMATV